MTAAHSQFIIIRNAGGRTRTGTDFTPRDFKSLVSANSTTPAKRKTTQRGLEPLASAVTGRRSNQLSHWALILPDMAETTNWIFGDSNPGPTGYEPVALTN